MKICILHPSYEGSLSPCKGLDPEAVPERWIGREHTWQAVRLRKATCAREIVALSRQGFDVFLNLCDGAWDEDRPGKEVVETLERLGLPFTGARSHFYEPSKETMKMVALYHGIRTPNYCVCLAPEDAAAAASRLTFPVIVKHCSGYSSIGMTPASKCLDQAGLQSEVNRMVKEYGGALVEEFITGREFTVLVSDCPPTDAQGRPTGPGAPVAYQPVECVFPEDEEFKHFEMKWVTHQGIQWKPVVEPRLDQELRDMAVDMFKALRGTGYGRIDVRMDSDGTLFFLEMNPNCGVFLPPEEAASADQILACDPQAHHGLFLERILGAALWRHQAAQPCFKVALKGIDAGYGLFATRPIAEGETVDNLEEAPVPLVSRGHVERTWDERKRRWFGQYCYPVGRGVWAMWGPDPASWKPINHSCNPNAWLHGLNLTARRAIALGEELTVDYATFCVDSEPFDCTCAAKVCRGKVTGKDYLAPWLRAKYGDHVSGYVLEALSAEDGARDDNKDGGLAMKAAETGSNGLCA